MGFLYSRTLNEIYNTLADAGLAEQRNGIWYEKSGVTVNRASPGGGRRAGESYVVRVEMRSGPECIRTTETLRRIFSGVSHVTVDSPRRLGRPVGDAAKP